MSDFKRLVGDLDPLLHERGRLAIVSALAAAPGLTFTELRDTLDMTDPAALDADGNVHLLPVDEQHGVVLAEEHVGARRPRLQTAPDRNDDYERGQDQ